MTREEAISILQDEAYFLYEDDVPYNRQAFDMAIQALSQEPCDKEYETYCSHKCNKCVDNECPLREQEPCDDAISREAVDKYIARLLSGYLYDGERERLEIFSAYLWELPSVTQKSETVTEFADRCRECGARYGKLLEQKSGKWERHYIRPNVYKDLLWYCSACGIGCGYNNAFMFDYCPNCGAKMESEDKE